MLRLYPEPPHISVAFCLDRLGPQEGFAAVCEALFATGATPTGDVEQVRSLQFPRFAMISDLASQLEEEKIEIRSDKDVKALMRAIQEDHAGSKILRAGFETRQAGLAVVAFEPLPDTMDRNATHPLSITVGGSLISMPAQVSLSKQNRQKSIKLAEFLVTLLRSVCELHEPLYGGIVVEANFPSLEELVIGTARVGTELFLSRRVQQLDPRIGHDMAQVFLGGSLEHWTTGTFFSGWSIFNSNARMVDKPLHVGETAARRLGRALKSLHETTQRKRGMDT